MKKDLKTIASNGRIRYIYVFWMWGFPAFFIISARTMNETLTTTIEALLHGGEVRLVDLHFSAGGRKRLLEVFVDTEHGVTADELAEVSRKLEEAIETRGLVAESYTLVVSSPGLDRPVRFPWQYRRHLGRSVSVLYRQSDQRMEHLGEIVDVDEEQLLLRDGDGLRAIPHEMIERALIQAKV
ncbi:MAG: hypothetical protein JXA28_02895 [Bacteroidetes bacterium]|nr:hypothetical protein [Bacteroidota bacterium]